MELIAIVGAVLLLDLAALRWGRDSRDPARDIPGTGGLLPLAVRRVAVPSGDDRRPLGRR